MTLPSTARITPLPEAFCWSKMGTEAGQGLDTILARKELERRANRGYFLWGVGNSVMPALVELFRLESEPLVAFSEMRSKPKGIDERPAAVFVWMAAEKPGDGIFKIPPYSIVTSRAYGPSLVHKRSHYALVCFSEAPLTEKTRIHGSLDAAALVNLRTGKRVGSSQVTSVVTRSRETQESGVAEYRVNMAALLSPPGQVRLGSPALLSADHATALEEAAQSDSVQYWIQAVSDIRERWASHSENPEEQLALALS